MRYKKILITGGAGFVGSNLALKFKKKYPRLQVIAFDNLKRRGSELNLSRLKDEGVSFIHGDIRCREDLEDLGLGRNFLMIECSAEPSVLAGINSSPNYIINTNLIGAFNCLELVRRSQADIIFLSTSRVYSIETLNNLKFTEKTTRFEWQGKQKINGFSSSGISEEFSLDGSRSFYGTTKLAAELLIQEYITYYDVKGIINRCGIIAGPWQMGKVDQGVIVLWMARHIFKKPLSYIGFGGEGKQVRDFIHINDLFNLLSLQIAAINKCNNQVFNIGGEKTNSFSLLELTDYCQKISGNKIEIKSAEETRKADIRIYISDCGKIRRKIGWQPQKNISQTLEEIYQWVKKNKDSLKNVLE